jgi:hypothetical protein
LRDDDRNRSLADEVEIGTNARELGWTSLAEAKGRAGDLLRYRQAFAPDQIGDISPVAEDNIDIVPANPARDESLERRLSDVVGE